MIQAVERKSGGRRTMNCAELCQGVPGVEVHVGHDEEIAHVRVDSRKIEEGDLFVAIPGLETQGMRFAPSAISNGAAGVVAPVGAPRLPARVWVEAEDVRLAAARLSSRVWGNPSETLPVVGITGTNGKTTTSFLVRSIFEAAGRRVALLGTLGTWLPAGRLPQARTTPEAPELTEILSTALEQRAEVAVMEVSSHSLDLRRVDGTVFSTAAFLNLTPEHLDWHGTLEKYAESKTRLFRELLKTGKNSHGPRAVLCLDDPWAARVRDDVEEAATFAVGGVDADVTALGLAFGKTTHFTLKTPLGEREVELALPGKHNVSNALAAATIALVNGISLDSIAQGLATATPPPGRFERVHQGTFDAYVDYAHTEDGLENALGVARAIAEGRVFVVLGCGGDRDESKRPTMGKIAATLADHAFFTSDNPRNEDPAQIVETMLSQVGERRSQITVELDRREALRLAVNEARAGDVVLATGKGAEVVQQVGGEEQPFDEREILAELARDADSKRS